MGGKEERGQVSNSGGEKTHAMKRHIVNGKNNDKKKNQKRKRNKEQRMARMMKEKEHTQKVCTENGKCGLGHMMQRRSQKGWFVGNTYTSRARECVSEGER